MKRIRKQGREDREHKKGIRGIKKICFGSRESEEKQDKVIRETDKKQTWESGSLPDAFNFLDPELKTKSDSIQTVGTKTSVALNLVKVYIFQKVI